MRLTRNSVAALSVLQIALFGWVLLTGLRSTWSLVPAAFVVGGTAALIWAVRPGLRGVAATARCLTLAAAGATLIYPLASAALHQSGSREALPYMAAHPSGAWFFLPVLALVVLVGRHGRRPAGVA